MPPSLAKDLYAAIEVRNRLVHRYFRERAVEIVTPPGRAEMIRELNEWRDLLEDVNEDAGADHPGRDGAAGDHGGGDPGGDGAVDGGEVSPLRSALLDTSPTSRYIR